jgi:hypothetical protein
MPTYEIRRGFTEKHRIKAANAKDAVKLFKMQYGSDLPLWQRKLVVKKVSRSG